MHRFLRLTLQLFAFVLTLNIHSIAAEKRLLYVATPGIRDYLEYGGPGVIVFDNENHHQFLKRIPLAGLDASGKPLNIKGVAAHAGTKRLYVTTTRTLTALD